VNLTKLRASPVQAQIRAPIQFYEVGTRFWLSRGSDPTPDSK
jgi:hypothetical protein